MNRITREHFVSRLRAACRKAGGQAAWAAEHGIAPSVVSDVIHGRREPPKPLLAALGLERAPPAYRQKRDDATAWREQRKT